MYNVLTLNKIAAVGTKRLGDNYTCGNDVQDPDAILVRSAAMHDMEFGDNLLAIARAGAGTNNIPKDKCTEQGICVFNTPGANANAVKELVLTGLLLASRKVVEGIEWAKTLKGSGDEMGKKVEKGKSQFVGPEITGKTLGVVGLGAIGILVRMLPLPSAWMLSALTPSSAKPTRQSSIPLSKSWAAMRRSWSTAITSPFTCRCFPTPRIW